jgi:hypothetical protein
VEDKKILIEKGYNRERQIDRKTERQKDRKAERHNNRKT